MLAIRVGFTAFTSAHRSSMPDEAESELLRRWYAVSGQHWRRFQHGELSFEEQRRARMRDFLNTPLTNAEADIAFEHYGHAYEASWKLAPGCAEFLALTTGIPKVVITDGVRFLPYRSELMPDLVAELSERAKVLPPEDLARLTEALLASLEESPSAEVDAAWDTEIQRRIAEVEARTAELVPAEEVFARVRQSLR